MPEATRTKEGTGDEESFDAHHQLQAALIDAYEAALLDGSSQSLAADTLGHLVDFTAAHFQEEERFMRRQAYPAAEPHRLAHARLLEQIRALEVEARAGEREVAKAAVPRLRTWLTEHVRGMDRDVFTWVNGGASGPRPGR
jgi:hemerythrin-like metal-binding protein